MAAWIGTADLAAPGQDDLSNVGPVAHALASRRFDRVLLLADQGQVRIELYLAWLRLRTEALVIVEHVMLTSPTNFGEIYASAGAALDKQLNELGSGVELTFHLSPGTPAMAAVWIILAKTRYPAELIESSRQHGVKTASVPFDISAELVPDLIRSADGQLASQSAEAPPAHAAFSDIVYRGPAMAALIRRAEKAARRSVPVLIEGESGTGKELLARAIHRASPRADRPFLVVNCGAIPENLVESTLFGHVRGAFTGAARDHAGLFREADKGSLFLDEIGELPLPAQVKLLRALQEGEVVPVGATRPVRVDVRVIAATNRNLVDEVTADRFREDLFYRLAVAVLRVPPLRERTGDLGPLIDHALVRVNAESGGQPGYERKKISAGARNLLLRCSWPGNMRELQNTLRRAAVWSEGPTIREEDVREALLAVPGRRGTALGILDRAIGQGFDLEALLGDVARHYLARAMAEAGGNKTRAAQLLGIPSYQTLTNWLKRYRPVG